MFHISNRALLCFCFLHPFEPTCLWFVGPPAGHLPSIIDCSLAPPTKEARDACPSLKRSVAGAGGVDGGDDAVAIVDEPESRWSTSTPAIDGTRPTAVIDTTGAEQHSGGDDDNNDDDDDWKDYSCATLWEYFINDVDSAIGAIENTRNGGGGGRRVAVTAGDGDAGRTAAAAAAAIGSGRQGACSRRQRLAYNGRSYTLRRLYRGALAGAAEEARV